MIRMDLGDLCDRQDFIQRIAYLRLPEASVQAGARAYAWGYDWRLIVSALRSGCDDPYEVANWCDVHGEQLT